MKKFFPVLTLLVLLLSLFILVVPVVAAPLAQTGEGVTIEQILSAVFGLIVAVPGFALLISAVINLLKAFNIVKDGFAEIAFNILNIVVAIGLGLWATFNPTFLDRLPALDSIAGAVGNLLMVLITIFGASLLKTKAYSTLKGVPLLGYSHTKSQG